MTAPDQINSLNPGEVFVFGSHISGHHAGGAARFAVERFGAVVGQGEGLQGSSYAIPTMGSNEDFARAVDRFLQFARLAPGLTFLVTAVGTGIAGHPVERVALRFRNAPDNVHLPASFERVIATDKIGAV